MHQTPLRVAWRRYCSAARNVVGNTCASNKHPREVPQIGTQRKELSATAEKHLRKAQKTRRRRNTRAQREELSATAEKHLREVPRSGPKRKHLFFVV
ncbi:hypothetical protein KQI65_12220 [bacterium]|nr:hypothetical protein [bacterium]